MVDIPTTVGEGFSSGGHSRGWSRRARRRWLESCACAFVASVALGLGTTAASAQCPSGAFLRGDAELVAELSEALESRGTPVASSADCASLAVEVTASGSRIHLSLDDTTGSPTVRDLDHVATAALLVESWLEAAEVDLLEPPVATAVTSEETTQPTSDPPPAATAAAATGEPSEHEEQPSVVTMIARGEAAFGNDGSTWVGARLGACAHAGPTCIGGIARYVADSGLSEGTIADGEQRVLLAVDAEVSVPIVVAPGISVIPALAVGLGWLRVTVAEEGRSGSADGFRALVTGSIAGAVALVDWLSLELTLGATWSPLARTTAWIVDGVSVDPDPIVLSAATLGLRAEIR